jgi:tetratricopeptide (TPR) repeat protein
VDVAPTHVNGLYTLASALQMQARPADAIPYYERAIAAATPDRAGEIHNDAGVAYAQTGRMREALSHFREAVRLRPDLPDARANLARAQGR